MYRPSPKAVAVRLICLTSVAARAFLENVLARAGTPGGRGPHTRIDKLLDWLRKERLWNRLSVHEREAMAKPSGTWDERERTNASWRIEAAGAVAWSLGLIGKIPAYDTEFDGSGVWAVVPRIGESTRECIRKATFRPEQQVLEAREIAELWVAVTNGGAAG